ncbi:unnamed protein product [Rhizophagus irregularis]|nr:unnamed protein product [Rhizophagus irregularis]
MIFNVNSNPQFNTDFLTLLLIIIVYTIHNILNTNRLPQRNPMSSSFYNSHISSTIAPEKNDVDSSNGSSGEYGLELWNKRRELWIRGNNSNPRTSSSNRNNPAS